MVPDLSHSDLIERTARMRALSDDDRATAIDASPNVVGFGRFGDRARQQQLSDSYRKPIGGGHA